MPGPESLIKYASAETAEIILSTGTLRWSSPELFDEPWTVRHDPKLKFDHMVINKAMLQTAVSMIFTRDIPAGNPDHPLYKAIKRWRGEERFKDEPEAFEALSELLAPTPETLEAKLKHMVAAWKERVSNARILCLSETTKSMECWNSYADNHRGLAFRFERDSQGSMKKPKQVEYSNQRPHLTTVREQVEDLVGIQRAEILEHFDEKMLSKSKADTTEKEWRCIRVLEEDELDCGEDVEDWYLDEPFNPEELKAVYFGFRMPEKRRQELTSLLQISFPSAVLYQAQQAEDVYDLEFEKINI